MDKVQSNHILLGVVAIGAVVVAFYAGMHIAQRRSSVLGNRFMQGTPGTWSRGVSAGMMGRGMMGYGNFGMRGMRGRGLNGTVEGINGNQLTIRLQNGVTQTLTLSDTATYTQVSQASKSNVTQGEHVVLSGQNINGTFTVTQIRIVSVTATPTPAVRTQ